MNILEEIALKRKQAIEIKKQNITIEEIKTKAKLLMKEEQFAFEKCLKGEDIHFICEVKRASPSKGLIANDFPYIDIAKEYEEAGASALSVLTEPDYFLGKDEYLKEIVEKVHIPVLRKDFIVDVYQIYEAKVLGASAILLICSLLDDESLKEFLEIAHSLGISALVETHDDFEVKRALSLGARIIGVNNRNLKDFTVDIENSVHLRKMVPDDVIFVSESGMKTAEDIQVLKDNGTHAVLIGETLMRAKDKRKMLKELSGGNL